MDKYNIPLQSFKNIYKQGRQSNIRFWFTGFLLFMLLVLFLPWTQNIKSKGLITTLSQERRPQDVNSPIPGRIIKWWVREGDFVKKGDTLLQISEIKEEYLDPKLVDRTQDQVNSKKESISFYRMKVDAAKNQIAALKSAKKLKIEQLENKLKQLENKIKGEKAEIGAANNETIMAKDQFVRQQKMYDEGLATQTQLQQRNVAYQNAQAKLIVCENKLVQTQQEVINVQIEKNSVAQEYAEKIGKAESDQFQSMSMITTGEGDMAKLENQVSNYIIRNNMYLIIAPQDGQIVQAKKSGIGEIIKEGERITLIVPSRLDYAVEIFVRPVDLPLVNIGQRVRFVFDGFPAILFSGWPETSYGTFGGKVVVCENTINEKGMFRVLVEEDKTDRPWPPQLKLGGGAQSIALLKDVPIWYELWRNLNGFPPDYYTIEPTKEKSKK